MRYKIILSRTFRRDFSRYSENLSEYRSADASEAFTDSVLEAGDRLSSSPYIGRKASIEGIRSVQVKYDIRMYYRVSEDAVELVALMSTKADPENNPFE